jgi:hypothetical protein
MFDSARPCVSGVANGMTKYSGVAFDAFDGQYIYFVPHTGSVVARFEAKSVNKGLFPPSYKGSWW